MKTVREVLRSAGFMREASILLFGFAALGGLFSIILLTAGQPDSDALTSGVGMLAQAIIYVVLAILIRRGSLVALWAAGVLFALDTLLAFVLPSGKGLGAMIVSRGLLIYVLVRNIRRQLAAA